MEAEKKKIVVLPGEVIPTHCKDPENIKISGHFALDPEKQAIVSTNVGILSLKKHKDQLRVSIITKPMKVITFRFHNLKYYPEKDDKVIGLIVNKSADFYTVDIGGPAEAMLSVIDFEGATKRNRPFLEVGNIIYAKVYAVNKFTRPQISCISKMSKKDWASGESEYGELKEGMVKEYPIYWCRELLKDSKGLLGELQKYVSYEIAVGINGKVWVKSNTHKNVILILNCIKKAESLSTDEVISDSRLSIG